MDSPVVQAVMLGVLQGLTEFLPVSSSGHLALAQQMIPGFKQPGVLLDVVLHVGTMLAACAYFRREIYGIILSIPKMLGSELETEQDQARRLLMGIIIASLPTAVIGLFLEERAEALFASVTAVGAALVLTGAVLIAGEAVGQRRPAKAGNPGAGASFWIGVAQGIAVVPGLSRSGATISMARGLGVGREEAARFSFLAALPAVSGAALLSALKHAEEIRAFSGEQIIAYLAGPLVAAAVGYAAIAVVMRMIKGGTLQWFAVYCLVLGAISIALGSR